MIDWYKLQLVDTHTRVSNSSELGICMSEREDAPRAIQLRVVGGDDDGPSAVKIFHRTCQVHEPQQWISAMYTCGDLILHVFN